jgi:hypothetical protein
VYLSVWFYVSLRARCHWSTVFYLRKGSKTPEATSDLALIDQKGRHHPGRPGIQSYRGLRVDAHTHTLTSDNVGEDFSIGNFIVLY